MGSGFRLSPHSSPCVCEALLSFSLGDQVTALFGVLLGNNRIG